MHPNFARNVATVLGVASFAVAAQAVAQLTLYEGENFHGRSFPANGTATNLDGSGFNDRASSAIGDHGRWELCEHADFGGRCIVLKPGQYPSLAYAGLNNQVSSMRRVNNRPDYGYAPPPPPPSQPYPYYTRYGETLYQANVVAVRAVVGPPEQRCWVEQQQVTSGGGPNVPGASIGGGLRGVLGHPGGR